AGELHDEMKEVGARLLVRTMEGLVNGTLKEMPQAEVATEALRHAPKLFTETCKIDWNKSTDDVHNLIRGLSPFPGAFTYWNDKLLKIFRCSKEDRKRPAVPGEWETDRKTYLRFVTS